MKSKVLAALVLFSTSLGLNAAPESEKTRQVRTLVVREYWIPEYVVNKTGFLVPGAPKPHEVPPENLAIRGAKAPDLLVAPLNIIGEAKRIVSDKVEYGLAEKETSAESPAKAAPTTKTAEKIVFKPLFALPLSGADNLVCIYPKPKNDWRTINRLVVGLDSVKPGDNKVLVINVSSYPIAVPAADGRPVMVPPSGHVFVVRQVQGADKIRVRAVAIMGGRQQVVANTSMNIVPDQLTVLTFVNADPESGNCGVDFLKDAISYPPPPQPAEVPVVKK